MNALLASTTHSPPPARHTLFKGERKVLQSGCLSQSMHICAGDEIIKRPLAKPSQLPLQEWKNYPCCNAYTGGDTEGFGSPCDPLEELGIALEPRELG
jgi:hypothetical protein